MRRFLTALVALAALTAPILLLLYLIRPTYEADLPAEYRRRNPIAPHPERIRKGRQLYVESCLPCHGKTARGDGPASVSLDPKPQDLHDPTIQKHTDAWFFWRITEGKKGTAMPSFKSSLSPDQRWAIIHWLRTLEEERDT